MADSRKKVSERLVSRIEVDLGIRLVKIERGTRGKYGKQAGEFSWSGFTDKGELIGSEDTMTQCVMADKIYVDSRHDALHVSAETTNSRDRLGAGEQDSER
jgi:hypothetical protein